SNKSLLSERELLKKSTKLIALVDILAIGCPIPKHKSPSSELKKNSHFVLTVPPSGSMILSSSTVNDCREAFHAFIRWLSYSDQFEAKKQSEKINDFSLLTRNVEALSMPE